MISIVIGAILAVIFAALVAARVRYGSLRVSELPALLLALLAGSEEKKRLRLILEHRDMAAVPPTMPEAGPPPRTKRGSAATLQRFEDDRRAMRELARNWHRRAARCPLGHADQQWVQGEGLWCPQCDARRGTGASTVTYTQGGPITATGGGAGGTSETTTRDYPGHDPSVP
jgi:hypothetical protein